MSPELRLNERVAALEPQLEDLKADVDNLREFKELMIRELAELTASVKSLTWKVSVATGAIMVLVEQLTQWGVKKFLP